MFVTCLIIVLPLFYCAVIFQVLCKVSVAQIFLRNEQLIITITWLKVRTKLIYTI